MADLDLDLARRAVAATGWRWMPGMADTQGGRLSICGAWDQPPDWSVEAFRALNYAHLPDLDDPGTIGCLLALVRERHGPMTWCAPSWTPGVWLVLWRGTPPLIARGPTEAAALVAALEARHS